MDYLFWLLILLNILSFLVFGIDKYFAIKQKHRIAEKNLVMLTLFGGSIGSVVAMFLFRHKISKPSFLWKIMVIIILQIILLYLIFNFLKK